MNGDVWRDRLERPIKQYLTYWHGAADDPVRQHQYYRCEGCKHLVTWHQIRQGGCTCGIGSRVRAAGLTRREKWRLLLFPWTV